jgi:hypothetical protein
MQKLKLLKISLAVVALVALIQSASHAMQRGCPQFLQDMSNGTINVCQVYTTYHDMLLDQVVPRGQASDYNRIAQIWGPRFINYPDFFTTRGPARGFNPWYIYDPAPDTWRGWQAAADVVGGYVSQNIRDSGAIPGRSRSRDGLRPLTFGMIREIHAAALRGLPNSQNYIRDHGEMGLAFWRSSAVALEIARAGIRYPDASSPVLVRFTQTKCFEDMSAAEQALVNNRQYNSVPEDTTATFTGTSGGRTAVMSCGFYTYPDQDVLEDQIDLLLADINPRIERFYNGSNEDPVAVAARAQRWLVSIHPFRDGNGRTTRFVMDYILTSLGLPPPILDEMNLDTSVSETDWAQEVGEGMRRYNTLLGQCLANPSQPQCRITPRTPGPLN